MSLKGSHLWSDIMACCDYKSLWNRLEDHVRNIILNDPEGNYEIGWNSAVRDIISEIEHLRTELREALNDNELQRKTHRIPQRSIRKD